jgi:hypothetical protein
MTDAAPSLPDPAPPWPAGEIVSGVWQSGSPQPGEHWDAVIDLDGSAPPLDGIALYVHWLIEDGPAPERATLVALADLVNDLRRAASGCSSTVPEVSTAPACCPPLLSCATG